MQKVVTVVTGVNEMGEFNLAVENSALNKYLEEGYEIEDIIDVTPSQSSNVSMVTYVLKKARPA